MRWRTSFGRTPRRAARRSWGGGLPRPLTMPSIDRARDYVYRHGEAWERALFGHLLDGRPYRELQGALLAFKNPDGGFGHGLEHDLRTPSSNPAQLELLLLLERSLGLEVRPLLAGTVAWLERMQGEDGRLANPSDLAEHPIAPWWLEWGGQFAPDSIVGNLARLGLATPKLRERTLRWVAAERTPESVRESAWLFMLYHEVDYFFGVDDHPNLERWRDDTTETVVRLAAAAPDEQRGTLLALAGNATLRERLPTHLLDRDLDLVAAAQQDDGSWHDQHGLPQWYPLPRAL